MQIKLKIKTRSKKHGLISEKDGILTWGVSSPPVDGKANQELIKGLAKHFSVKQSDVRIKLGNSSKLKLVEIQKT